MQRNELLYGVVIWVVIWLLYGCYMVVIWKSSHFVNAHSSGASGSDISDTAVAIASVETAVETEGSYFAAV